MKKKNRNKFFDKENNAKQNSLPSGIRIGEFGIVFVHNKEEHNCQFFKTTQMKERLNNLPFRWIFRIAIIALASYITRLSFWWCFLAYIGIMFLIQFAKNMIIVILGIVIVITISLAMFFGLLTL